MVGDGTPTIGGFFAWLVRRNTYFTLSMNGDSNESRLFGTANNHKGLFCMVGDGTPVNIKHGW